MDFLFKGIEETNYLDLTESLRVIYADQCVGSCNVKSKTTLKDVRVFLEKDFADVLPSVFEFYRVDEEIKIPVGFSQEAEILGKECMPSISIRAKPKKRIAEQIILVLQSKNLRQTILNPPHYSFLDLKKEASRCFQIRETALVLEDEKGTRFADSANVFDSVTSSDKRVYVSENSSPTFSTSSSVDRKIIETASQLNRTNINEMKSSNGCSNKGSSVKGKGSTKLRRRSSYTTQSQYSQLKTEESIDEKIRCSLWVLFMSYTVQGKSTSLEVMALQQFNKLMSDARIIPNHLTLPKTGLVYSAVVKKNGSRRMCFMMFIKALRDIQLKMRIHDFEEFVDRFLTPLFKRCNATEWVKEQQLLRNPKVQAISAFMEPGLLMLFDFYTRDVRQKRSATPIRRGSSSGSGSGNLAVRKLKIVPKEAAMTFSQFNRMCSDLGLGSLHMSSQRMAECFVSSAACSSCAFRSSRTDEMLNKISSAHQKAKPRSKKLNLLVQHQQSSGSSLVSPTSTVFTVKSTSGPLSPPNINSATSTHEFNNNFINSVTGKSNRRHHKGIEEEGSRAEDEEIGLDEDRLHASNMRKMKSDSDLFKEEDNESESEDNQDDHSNNITKEGDTDITIPQGEISVSCDQYLELIARLSILGFGNSTNNDDIVQAYKIFMQHLSRNLQGQRLTGVMNHRINFGSCPSDLIAAANSIHALVLRLRKMDALKSQGLMKTQNRPTTSSIISKKQESRKSNTNTNIMSSTRGRRAQSASRVRRSNKNVDAESSSVNLRCPSPPRTTGRELLKSSRSRLKDSMRQRSIPNNMRSVLKSPTIAPANNNSLSHSMVNAKPLSRSDLRNSMSSVTSAKSSASRRSSFRSTISSKPRHQPITGTSQDSNSELTSSRISSKSHLTQNMRSFLQSSIAPMRTSTEIESVPFTNKSHSRTAFLDSVSSRSRPLHFSPKERFRMSYLKSSHTSSTSSEKEEKSIESEKQQQFPITVDSPLSKSILQPASPVPETPKTISSNEEEEEKRNVNDDDDEDDISDEEKMKQIASMSKHELMRGGFFETTFIEPNPQTSPSSNSSQGQAKTDDLNQQVTINNILKRKTHGSQQQQQQQQNGTSKKDVPTAFRLYCWADDEMLHWKSFNKQSLGSVLQGSLPFRLIGEIDYVGQHTIVLTLLSGIQHSQSASALSTDLKFTSVQLRTSSERVFSLWMHGLQNSIINQMT